MKVYVDRRMQRTTASVDAMFKTVCRIGGENGWYSPNWLWRLRGVLDRMVGGPGMGGARRDPDHLELDDRVGFWRVVNVEEPKTVHLIAEMKVPGIAALEFDIDPAPSGTGSILTHTAKFEPDGVFGHLYWWAMVPAHGWVFGSMVRNMVAEAERLERGVSRG